MSSLRQRQQRKQAEIRHYCRVDASAFSSTCGITFTFGGLRIDSEAHVVDVGGMPISGLFACEELAAGIFFFNYPGGTGLTNGSVFGRIAGTAAARSVLQA